MEKEAPCTAPVSGMYLVQWDPTKLDLTQFVETFDADGNNYYACRECGWSIYGETVAALVADAVAHECKPQVGGSVNE